MGGDADESVSNRFDVPIARESGLVLDHERLAPSARMHQCARGGWDYNPLLFHLLLRAVAIMRQIILSIYGDHQMSNLGADAKKPNRL